MIAVPWMSGQCEFSVVFPFSLFQHSQLHHQLCDYKKWAQKFFVEGVFLPAGNHQQSPSFSTKNSAQIKIDLNFDTKKEQGNRLAGSFLSSWQGITINSLLPLAPKEICFPDYWKETHGEVGAIRTFCGAAALQKCWDLNHLDTSLLSNHPLELQMELFQKK